MIPPLRPALRLLEPSLVGRIVDEAFQVLAQTGIFIENQEAARLLQEAGASRDASGSRVLIPQALVERSLAAAPRTITLGDATGKTTFPVGGDAVHFDPGSAALRMFDPATSTEREAATADVVRFVRLTQQLDQYHFQSTGLISSDVPQPAGDAYRLYLALLYSTKPVVTGTFIVEGFSPMSEMLSAVRGGSGPLRSLPLAIFDACPSPPLKWSRLTAQSVIDCARAGIPSEFVAMPLTGATAPATLTGALVQHVAENLTGVAIAQTACSGSPVIFGGSPASFDLRAGTPPMGAIETMMIDVAYTQIGKSLGLPTHAYMGLSDSKSPDAQAGLESGIGAVLAALAGVNVVSGDGMMDYESCQSLEKLVIDSEIIAMAYRLLEGIRQREEPMAVTLLAELASGAEFITHPHTLEWYRKEQMYPKIIDRGNYQQWVDAGKPTLADRASRRAELLLKAPPVPVTGGALARELEAIMLAHARKYGMSSLPPLPA